ncbi:MAG: transposase [Pseudonocardia sp.]
MKQLAVLGSPIAQALSPSFPPEHGHRPEVATATREDAVVPASHPPEFRRRAVELAGERTRSIADLAKDLRISESCLRNWMSQADTDAAGSETQLTSKERKELGELRRDKRRLEMEVDILKRAAAYFAHENILPN